MPKPAVEIHNISKKFELGLVGAGTVRESISKFFSRKKYPNAYAKDDKEFWALKDVSFEVNPGEVVGLIGKNGAGKSTLLKVISKITQPTSGEIKLRGRVASLLEVGTGFHPELTGRENIFLNGSILGMSRKEIKSKFDEIVDFSGVEKFIDTPVKRFSSGMYVRLAFSVAAHLEPEILVVDEVLAVGDTEFQKKCIGKMDDVSKTGKTILFVSHNMSILSSLCDTGILLEKGSVVFQGSMEESIDRYLDQSSQASQHEVHFEEDPKRDIWISTLSIWSNGEIADNIFMGDHLSLKVAFQAKFEVNNLSIGFSIKTMKDVFVLNANNLYQPSEGFSQSLQFGAINCDLGQVPLMPGKYKVDVALGHSSQDLQILTDAIYFEVIEKDIWNQGKTPGKRGLIWWKTNFQLEGVPSRAT